MAKQWREAFCPVCGLSHGMINKTMPGRPRIVLEQESFWDRTESYNGDKPFGIIKESSGRSSIQLVGYYDVTEDEEGFFLQIKNRLCNVLSEWLEKGWLTPMELEGCIIGVTPGTAVKPPVEESIAPFKPTPIEPKVSKKKKAEEAKAAKKKEAKAKAAPPEGEEFVHVGVKEVISTETAFKEPAGIWKRQISELDDGTFLVEGFLEPKKPREREEGEYYSQTYDEETEAILVYDKLKSKRAMDTNLIKE